MTCAKTPADAPGHHENVNESAFNHGAVQFIHELDDTEQCHMEWTRRLLRCAVLRIAPGDEVLAEDAHRWCRLGRWLKHNHESLEKLNPVTVRHLRGQHRLMHATARSLCRRILAGEPGDAAELDTFERAQTAVIAGLTLLRTDYLAHSARIDALTGLPLRYGLAEEFARCQAQARRHRETLVALMVDLDHFKRINDEHGHAVGDRALRHVADLLRGHCRAGEPVFRFGGEEFLAFLQTADRAAAERAAERILQALRDDVLCLPDGRRLVVRASAGLAEVGATEAMAEAVARADRALYAAKLGGRDTWRWAPHA